MITADQLREILIYDPETGIFFRRVERGGIPAGSRVGLDTTAKGYRRIKISRKKYRAHRLAWLYTYGQWPEGQLDHINGDPSDNRISNLRLAAGWQNCGNARTRRNKQTSFKGVTPAGARFAATCRGQHIGYFPTPEEAHAAYCRAAAEAFGEFARFG